MNNIRRVHLMGIGGAGMSALAKLLYAHGLEVSGCDLQETHYDLGSIPFKIGHSHLHIDEFKPDALILSSAVHHDNEEVKEAELNGIKIFSRAQALSSLFNNFSGIGIAGAHGKTTTSSMTGLIFLRAGLDPTIYVGANVPDIGSNAVSGKGKYFIAELDESDGSFELFHPEIAIITNADWDHVDHYKTRDDVIDAFTRFADGRKENGTLILCAEDEGTQKVLERLKADDDDTQKALDSAEYEGRQKVLGSLKADDYDTQKALDSAEDEGRQKVLGSLKADNDDTQKALDSAEDEDGQNVLYSAEDKTKQNFLEHSKRRIIRYGFGKNYDWGAYDINFSHGGGTSCKVSHNGQFIGTLELKVSGEHNILNSLAAISAADLCGISFETSAKILRDFHGSERRMQIKGTTSSNILIMDDYAHHPSEISATLNAVKNIYPERRIIVIYQPHRFSRTAQFAPQIAQALSIADEIFLLPVYSAGEKELSHSSADEIINHAQKKITQLNFDGADKILMSTLQAGDLLLTMGAGDVYQIGEKILREIL